MELTDGRLASLDALRGLDTLCIAGLEVLVWALAATCPDSGWASALGEQFSHCPWEGLRLYDLVFPLFTFLAGVSMSFSLVRGGTRSRAVWRLVRRALALVLLGWAVNGVVTLDSGMRYASVLGLIGLSCLGGGLVYVFGGWRGSLVASVALLLLVGLWQSLGGDFTPAGCLNARLDQALLPGRLHSGAYDPEGVLCIVSAISLNLLGMLAGYWLRCAGSLLSRVLAPLGVGAILYLLGACALPALGLPCVKEIWTSSFVLAAGGISLVLLALFHLLVDAVPGGAKAAWPLRVVGMNALSCYLVTHVIDFAALTRRLFAGVCRWVAPPDWQSVALAVAGILLVWCLMFVLYRHRVFFRV